MQAGEEPAGDVEGDVAAVLVALDARANLDSQVEVIPNYFKLTPLCRQTLQVSFHLAGGMCPMLSMGSRNTVLANRTSGIQRPHTT